MLPHSLNGDSDPSQLLVKGFTSFHNEAIGVEHSFIYALSSGSIRICSLPNNIAVNKNSEFVIRKAPLNGTPHRVCYLPPECRPATAAQAPLPTYVVLVSRAVLSSEVALAQEQHLASLAGDDVEEEGGEEEEGQPVRFKRGPTAPYCAVPGRIV